MAGNSSFPNDPLAAPDDRSGQPTSVQKRLLQRFGKRLYNVLSAIFAIGVIGGSICLAFGQGVIGLSMISAGLLVVVAVVGFIAAVLIAALLRMVGRILMGRAPVDFIKAPPPPPLDSEAARVADELERIRLEFVAQRQVRLRFAMPIGLILGAFAGLQILNSSPGNYLPVVLIFLMVMGGAYVFATKSIELKYTAAFKQHMLPQLLSRHGKMAVAKDARPDFARAQLTGVMWRHDRMTVNDAFVGTYRDYPLEIYELALWRPNPSPFGKAEKHGTGKRCLGVVVTLQRPVKATTAVIDRHRFDEGAVSRDETLQAVDLEDPVFSRIYAVHSTDEVGARVMLTPAVMARMLAMADTGSFLPPALLADGTRLVFVLQFASDVELFEPPSVAFSMKAQLGFLDGELTQIFGMVDTMIAMGEAVAGRRTPVRTPN